MAGALQAGGLLRAHRAPFWHHWSASIASRFQRLAMSAANCFQTGQTVPESGVYRVTHGGHRLPHAVTICKGECFPRCAKCLDLVTFELLHAVECAFTYEPMHVYELHPVDDEQAASAIGASEP